jgi:septal ring factor EnvC (AmiA/AmiB activator)
MSTLAAALMDISLIQICGWAGTLAGGLWGFWKFMLSNRFAALKLNDESNFRWKQHFDAQQEKRWAEFRAEMADLKAERDRLHDEKIDLLRRITDLMEEVANLKAEIIGMRADIAKKGTI